MSKEIIPEMKVGNRWTNHNGDYPIWWHSAKESGHSLVKSQGMDIETTLILKQD